MLSPFVSEPTVDDYDTIQALIHMYGPSEAKRVLRRARRAVARDEQRTVQP